MLVLVRCKVPLFGGWSRHAPMLHVDEPAGHTSGALIRPGAARSSESAYLHHRSVSGLLDRAEEYARALRSASVTVHYKCYYAFHGFFGGVTTAEGEAALREAATVLAKLLSA